MISPRIRQQAAFLVEADKLKNILRRTLLTDQSRQENSAEHSWHLALAAVVLYEYFPEPVNLLRTLKMLIVHDLVEIDAGDTFAYDEAANLNRAERERAAARRLFGILPSDLAEELNELWRDFETHKSAESRFAQAVDRFQPFLQNDATAGGTWRIHKLNREQVLARMEPVRTALPALWPMVLEAIDEFFAPKP